MCRLVLTAADHDVGLLTQDTAVVNRLWRYSLHLILSELAFDIGRLIVTGLLLFHGTRHRDGKATHTLILFKLVQPLLARLHLLGQAA